MSKESRLFGKLVRKWTQKTWLYLWQIDIHYLSSKEFAKTTGYSKKRTRSTIATCQSKWNYLVALIEVNKDVLKALSDSEIEEAVLHELSHIFLAEMADNDNKHEERVATLLARSFILCGGSQLEELVESK